MVGHHIEISNRFLHDFEATITIAKQCKAKPCHKSPFAKGGFRGNVNVIEDISPRTALAVARIPLSADQRSSNRLIYIRATSDIM